MPAVSIIVPVRNEERHLRECLSSISGQSFADWEAIVVDDHSTDRTAAIALAFSDKDLRFRYITNRGRGIIAALDTAVACCSGTWITRMDGDDRMPLQKLRTLHQALKDHPKNTIAVGRVEYFADTPVSPGYKAYENWLNERVTQDDHWDHLFRECVIPSCGWMMHRESFLATFVPGELQYPEDYHLCFHWYRAGYRIIPVRQPVHYWREHPHRISKTSTDYSIASFFRLKWHQFREITAGDTPFDLVLWGRGPKLELLKQAGGKSLSAARTLSHPEQAAGELQAIIRSASNPVKIISVVGSGEGLRQSRKLFEELGLSCNRDYFLF